MHPSPRSTVLPRRLPLPPPSKLQSRPPDPVPFRSPSPTRTPPLHDHTQGKREGRRARSSCRSPSMALELAVYMCGCGLESRLRPSKRRGRGVLTLPRLDGVIITREPNTELSCAAASRICHWLSCATASGASQPPRRQLQRLVMPPRWRAVRTQPAARRRCSSVHPTEARRLMPLPLKREAGAPSRWGLHPPESWRAVRPQPAARRRRSSVRPTEARRLMPLPLQRESGALSSCAFHPPADVPLGFLSRS